MTGETDSELKEREFYLKLVQAWLDIKFKMATAATLVNGALLTTIIAQAKSGEFPALILWPFLISSLGLLAGLFAYFFVWFASEFAMSAVFRGDKESLLEMPGMNSLFGACIVAAGMGFSGSVIMYSTAVFSGNFK